MQVKLDNIEKGVSRNITINGLLKKMLKEQIQSGMYKLQLQSSPEEVKVDRVHRVLFPPPNPCNRPRNQTECHQQ